MVAHGCAGKLCERQVYNQGPYLHSAVEREWLEGLGDGVGPRGVIAVDDGDKGAQSAQLSFRPDSSHGRDTMKESGTVEVHGHAAHRQDLEARYRAIAAEESRALANQAGRGRLVGAGAREGLEEGRGGNVGVDDLEMVGKKVPLRGGSEGVRQTAEANDTHLRGCIPLQLVDEFQARFHGPIRARPTPRVVQDFDVVVVRVKRGGPEMSAVHADHQQHTGSGR